MILETIKDVVKCYGELYPKGKIFDYIPWNHKWQGMSEKKRVEKGIFVHCHGMGEFSVFRLNEDVRVLRKMSKSNANSSFQRAIY